MASQAIAEISPEISRLDSINDSSPPCATVAEFEQLASYYCLDFGVAAILVPGGLFCVEAYQNRCSTAHHRLPKSLVSACSTS